MEIFLALQKRNHHLDMFGTSVNRSPPVKFQMPVKKWVNLELCYNGQLTVKMNIIATSLVTMIPHNTNSNIVY
jgi:hypothetical protein